MSWKSLLIVLPFAAIFYFAFVVLSDFDGVVEAFRAFEWLYLAPVIGLVLVNYIVRAERWHSYLVKLDLAMPRARSYWLFVSGLSMSITPAKAGEALKALLLKIETGAPLERGVAIVFAERMSDLTGILVLIAIGSFALSYGFISFLVIVVAVAAILVLVSSESVSARFVRWMKSVRRVAKVGWILENVLKDAKSLLTGRNLVEGTAFGAAAWACECAGFYLILVGCSIEIGLLEAVFIYAFSSVIGAVSMLPGGMGTTEATMAGLLILLSISAPLASFAVVLTRAATLWFAVALGVVFLTAYAKRTGEFHSEPHGNQADR